MRNCAQIGIDDEIFVDSFAGGGGASTGMEVGLGITVAAAINHDPAAILMHKTNHPYYSGVVGEKMEEPLPTVTAIDHNAVCAAHVVKFKGDNLGSSPAEPMQTVTAGAGQNRACGGGTFALCDTVLCKVGPGERLYRWPQIRDLLNRYCGYELADDDLLLLSIGGTLYFIADIGLRMLSPRELYNAMGFPPDYIIDRDYMGNPYPKNEQVARCGNAVCPPMAAAVARANFPEYVARVGDTITTMAALLDMVAV